MPSPVSSDQGSTDLINSRQTVASQRPKHPLFVIWVTALRAVLAFAIGIALLTSSDGGRLAVAGFMGLYWLVSGIFSLAWARRGPFLQRLSLVSGIIGVITGVLLILYRLGAPISPTPSVVLVWFGVIVAITGVMHITGGFLVGERIDRWPAGHVLLGLLEVVLGLIVVIAPERTELLESAAAIWAFAAGLVLAFDALRLQRRWGNPEAES